MTQGTEQTGFEQTDAVSTTPLDTRFVVDERSGFEVEYKSWEGGKILAILYTSVSQQQQRLCSTLAEAEAFIAEEVSRRENRRY